VLQLYCACTELRTCGVSMTERPLGYHHDVRAYLDDSSRAQWTGRRESVEHTPQLPDLIPPDIFPVILARH